MVGLSRNHVKCRVIGDYTGDFQSIGLAHG